MNISDYKSIEISIEQALEIASSLYDIKGDIKKLPGDLDFNFYLKDNNSISYILKISRPQEDIDYLDFQQSILKFVSSTNIGLISPIPYSDKNGNLISETIDSKGNVRKVRLLSWIEGRLWSDVNPISNDLLYSLGKETGKLTKSLIDFNHKKAHREFDWDIAQSNWTKEYLHLFDENKKEIISHFQNLFEGFQYKYIKLRKSIVHNDANDNNIVVSNNLAAPKVKSIIDYGDSIYTYSINDLAITIAYAVMNKPDPLSASLPIIKGYHSQFLLLEEELNYLYTLIAMRLVISVTKSAISKEKEPDNEYLRISEIPAWDLLKKWVKVDRNYALYSFRNTCGFTPHPYSDKFINWANKQSFKTEDLFPNHKFDGIVSIDMSISSTFLGNESDYNNINWTKYMLEEYRSKNIGKLVTSGYNEIRPFFSKNNYKKEGNNGPEYSTVHLGTDFWMNEKTSISAILDGVVMSIFDNNKYKNYGPTLILEHKTSDGLTFFTLYGHLSRTIFDLFNEGDIVKKGDLIGHIGSSEENGEWYPHLHFQIILDLFGHKNNYPSVCFPDQREVWANICPNPNIFFNEILDTIQQESHYNTISYRKKHLGKSMSLSYDKPLKILRGQGVFLIDDTGRPYLDMVNNVAHVGHEHPRVVKAGCDQMKVLNTNTRYLHKNINEFTKELLSTLPDELSVVHFVNSGSEANELALRMTRAFKNRKDMIAVEIGYHGNTGGCIDISSYKFDGKGGNGAPEHTHIVPLPDRYRGIYLGSDSGPKYADHIKKQIENIHSKGRNLAGFICESIISCGGQIELPKDYLKIAYNLVREAGGLCISDEVQVGCGRVGSHFWGFQLHGVVPDIVTIGKPIGNGHPLAAVVCTREVADTFANGMEYFNTFGGNPVSCAIGTEVLKVIKEEKLQENAITIGNYLKNEFIKLQLDFPIIGDVRGQGLFLGFELVDNNQNPLRDKASYLANRMKDFAILMSQDGKDNNLLKIKPPIVFSKENADELIKRLKIVLEEDFMKNY